MGKRLGAAQIVVYSSPLLAASFIGSLSSTYYVKYGTDVLLMAPATIATLWGLARLIEAFSDPLVGYLSDRTRHRMGRRRSWMLLSMPALCLFPLMMWSPPASLTGGLLWLWIGIGTVGMSIAASAVTIPHAALGAELSPEPGDRSRLFATNGVMAALASFAALTLGIGLLRRAEDPRGTAQMVFTVVAVLLAALVVNMFARTQEPASHQGRGADSPFRAYRDVLRNRHAVILVAAGLFVQITYGSMTVVAVYMLQYVMKIPGSTELFMASYFIPNLIAVPLWVRLADRYEKRHLWMICLAGSALAYGGLGIGPESISLAVALPLAATMGLFGGGFFVFEPAIRAEVIDYDEYETGERKEGVYSAASQIVGKAAGAGITMFAGVALQWAGYVPNVEQADSVKLVIRCLFGGVPFVCFGIAFVLMYNFRLGRAEHAEVRVELDRRLHEETQTIKVPRP
jgi:GPH family glycoside/pentoside/hexuronide:cation symporter